MVIIISKFIIIKIRQKLKIAMKIKYRVKIQINNLMRKNTSSRAQKLRKINYLYSTFSRKKEDRTSRIMRNPRQIKKSIEIIRKLTGPK